MALPRIIFDTTQAHLERLVADRALEGPHLDFKRDIPNAWDQGARHELCADVSAFANAGGGDLIYGIEEDGAAGARALTPTVGLNADEIVRRIQDILMNNIEPRLPGVQVHSIELNIAGTQGIALIIRAPQSWAGPHRVKTNQHFFIREGGRKRQLDIPEIRGLFLRTESQAQRIKDFRTERLGKLLSGESPQKLVAGPLVVVHLIPTQSALGVVEIDPVPYTNIRQLPILGAGRGIGRINLDGALAVRNVQQDGSTHGYSQLFRNGFLESVYVLSSRLQDGKFNLASRAYEEHLIQLLAGFRQELMDLELSTEMTVMWSLLGADSVRLGVQNEWGFLDRHQTLFDRRVVVLPDNLAPAEQPPELALKATHDLVWQAAGFAGSQNYNQAGEWLPR